MYPNGGVRQCHEMQIADPASAPGGGIPEKIRVLLVCGLSNRYSALPVSAAI
jgi:hypothetical protein